jgi:hypothetical protein
MSWERILVIKLYMRLKNELLLNPKLLWLFNPDMLRGFVLKYRLCVLCMCRNDGSLIYFFVVFIFVLLMLFYSSLCLPDFLAP